MNQVYDFKRIILLARLKFNLNKKMLLLSVLGYFALLFIIGFFIAYSLRNATDSTPFFTVFHYIGLPVMMVLGSVLFAAKSFQDMNTPEKSIGQILIPASTFEKLILPLVSTSLIWLVFSFVSYHVFSLLFNSAWVAAFGFNFEIFNGLKIFNIPMMFEIIMGYFLLHSMFLLGATAFKKYPIVKTILVGNIMQWAYSLFALLVIVILFGSMESFGQAMESLGDILKNKEWFIDRYVYNGVEIEMMGYKMRYFWRFMMLLLTVVLYVTAYFKLKEREV